MIDEKLETGSFLSLFFLHINPIKIVKLIFKNLLILKKIHIMIFKTVFLFG
jgi:hypothetical protein